MIPRTIKYSFIVISFFLVFLLVSALNDYNHLLDSEGYKLRQINNQISTLVGQWQERQKDRTREYERKVQGLENTKLRLHTENLAALENYNSALKSARDRIDWENKEEKERLELHAQKTQEHKRKLEAWEQERKKYDDEFNIASVDLKKSHAERWEKVRVSLEDGRQQGYKEWIGKLEQDIKERERKEKERQELHAKKIKENERNLAALEPAWIKSNSLDSAEHKRKLAALEAEKEKMRSDIRIRQNESWDKVEFYLFSIFSLVFSFVVYFIIRKKREINNKIKEEKKRAKEEAERLERDRKRKEREEEESAQRVRLLKWTHKNEKLEKSINSIRSSLEEIKNQKPILNQQIEKLELEKKAIEENISQLSDDIKGEKKIVKELRKKYPFIDSYIENR